jgi:hypothetical protein
MMNELSAWDESHFDEMSWHDNHVYALRIRKGDDGSGELELDIDYILEWLRPSETSLAFRLAPATLTFREVFDLRIEIDYAAVGAGITPFSISVIDREVDDVGFCKWRVELGWPKGLISFSARGFTQILRSSPVVSECQSLEDVERPAL